MNEFQQDDALAEPGVTEPRSGDVGHARYGTPPGSASACPHPSLEPGQKCDCGYRKPHPKKETTPLSRPKSRRIPIDEFEAFKETQQAAAEYIGVHDQPYWEWKLDALAYALILQHPELEGYGKRAA